MRLCMEYLLRLPMMLGNALATELDTSSSPEVKGPNADEEANTQDQQPQSEHPEMELAGDLPVEQDTSANQDLDKHMEKLHAHVQAEDAQIQAEIAIHGSRTAQKQAIEQHEIDKNRVIETAQVDQARQVLLAEIAKTQDVEAARIAQEQATRERQIALTQQVERLRIAQEQTVQIRETEKNLVVEATRIDQTRQIQLAEIDKTLNTEVARIAQEQAVQRRDIDRLRDIETARTEQEEAALLRQIERTRAVKIARIEQEEAVQIRDMQRVVALEATKLNHCHQMLEHQQEMRQRQFDATAQHQEWLIRRTKHAVLALKCLDANETLAVVEPFLSEYATITVDKQTNSLVLRDIDSCIDEVTQLLAELDAPDLAGQDVPNQEGNS